MTQQPTGWEERFDKFVNEPRNNINDPWSIYIDQLKSFIHSLLSQKDEEIKEARKEGMRELIEIARSLKKPIIGEPAPRDVRNGELIYSSEMSLYNEALDDLEQKANSLLGKEEVCDQ